MAKYSLIEWLITFNDQYEIIDKGHTLNLWWGCTKVTKGCDHCYAENLSDTMKRGTLGTGLDRLWGEGVRRKMIKSSFSKLDKWQKQAQAINCRTTVFVGSMMDIFEKSKPLIDNKGVLFEQIETGDLRDQLFDRISRNLYPNLVFLFLTKRPSNINKMIPRKWVLFPPKNVWFGCSIVDKKNYENFYKHMQKVNGNTFYSVEPQLENIYLKNDDKVKWVIQGGESGADKRPFSLTWAKQMKIRCRELSIPYFFKQIDKKTSIPDKYLVREFPKF